MGRHEEESRAGDRLVRAGAVTFVVGVAAIAVIFVPFTIDLVRHGAREAQARHEYGLALNLATFLTCLGMAVAIVGLLRQAKQSRARARAGRS